MGSSIRVVVSRFVDVLTVVLVENKIPALGLAHNLDLFHRPLSLVSAYHLDSTIAIRTPPWPLLVLSRAKPTQPPPRPLCVIHKSKDSLLL